MLRGSLEKMGTIIAISIIPRKTPRKNVIIISFIVNLFFLNDVSDFIGASFFTNSYFNKVELSIKTIVSFKAKLDKIDLHRQSLRHSPGLINRYGTWRFLSTNISEIASGRRYPIQGDI